MGVGDTLAALRQMLVIAETQKRIEEDLKEMKVTLIRYGQRLDQLAGEVAANGKIAKNDIEHLAKQTGMALENLALTLDNKLKEIEIKSLMEQAEPKTQKRLLPLAKPAKKGRKKGSNQ